MYGMRVYLEFVGKQLASRLRGIRSNEIDLREGRK